MLTETERTEILTDILEMAQNHETLQVAENKRIFNITLPEYFITLTNGSQKPHVPIIEFSKEAGYDEYRNNLLENNTSIILYQGGAYGLFAIGYQIWQMDEEKLRPKEILFKSMTTKAYNPITSDDYERFDNYLMHIRNSLN